jgi:hypothetical protein
MLMTDERRVGGRYVLTDALGAHTWLARDTDRARDVVIRLGVPTEDLQAWRELSHPGLPSVYDAGREGDSAYLVVAHVARSPIDAERVDVTTLFTVIGQTAFAIGAIHDAGLVHGGPAPNDLHLHDDGSVTLTGLGRGREADGASDLRRLAGCVRALGTAAALDDSHLVAVLDRLDQATATTDVDDIARTALAAAGGRSVDAPSPPATQAPTEPRPVVGPTAAPTASVDTASVDTAPDEVSRRRVRNRLIAVGAAVVIVGVVLLRLVGGHSAQATVPSVTGRLYPAAVTRLHSAGLVAAERLVNNHALPAGTVTAQSVPPGRSVKAGSTVTLTVAAAGGSHAG